MIVIYSDQCMHYQWLIMASFQLTTTISWINCGDNQKPENLSTMIQGSISDIRLICCVGDGPVWWVDGLYGWMGDGGHPWSSLTTDVQILSRHDGQVQLINRKINLSPSPNQTCLHPFHVGHVTNRGIQHTICRCFHISFYCPELSPFHQNGEWGS